MKKKGCAIGFALVLALCLSVQAWAADRLVPVGSTVGIRLETGALMVVGFSADSAAERAGLEEGDLIETVNGQRVADTEQLRTVLARSSGTVRLEGTRDGRPISVAVTPSEQRKLGVYLRDSIAGIGTVTYYDPDSGAYGALGHGVSDLDTLELLPVESGELMKSEVVSVKKGEAGEPGQLQGAFDVEAHVGTVTRNTESGIFGTLDEAPGGCDPLTVAQRREIRTGAATILCNVSGSEVQEYEIRILKLYPLSDGSGRNMLIEVTDPRLLARTGGIVQGMSGSPILQDGKLVGAVTHVLVNDPTRGYGIFIENMLQAAA